MLTGTRSDRARVAETTADPLLSRTAHRFDGLTTPRPSGLPNGRVLFAFPVVLLAALAVLVGLGITGSSTGILNQFFSSEVDSNLIAGTPQSIRSDEWLVQTSLVISQVEQGLPTFNETFPGGTDSTVQSDLPSRDWSVAFRPHLLGFLVLPEDNAMSLRWWLPAFAMMAACYTFFVSMRPRRPLTAAAISIGFFFAPFFQWWFLPVTFWPVAWSLVVMTAAVWLVRDERRAPRYLWAALAGYLTVTMVIGVYVPFIIPVALVAVAFVVGVALSRRFPGRVTGLLSRLKALLPLIAAGAAAGLVVVAWLLTRIETIERFLGTLYPGQRLSKTGELSEHGLWSLLAAPFSRTLGAPTESHIDANASEASSFVLAGLFVIIPLVWFLWRDRRSKRGVDWLIVSLLVLTVIFAAYLVLPGWDPVAHLLLLDRSPAPRIRIGIGLLTVVLIAVFATRLESEREAGEKKEPIALALVATAAAALLVGGLAFVLREAGSNLVTGTWTWIPIAGLFVVVVYLIARGHFLVGSGALLAMSVLLAGGVNPVYVGAYDLNETDLVRSMKALDADGESDWVGVGHSYLPTVVLVQSGLHSYNGFQSAPSPEMWDQIDPADRYEQKWNRLANVSWVEGTGAPRPTNTQADTIMLNFDSCASFAQENVEFVLTDFELSQPCVRLVESVVEGPTTFWIYEVAPA